VDQAVKNAVSRKFEDKEYDSTDLFKQSFGGYMAVMISAMMTAGAGFIIYHLLSKAENAKLDEYLQRPLKHYNLMQARLSGQVNNIPNGPEKKALSEFLRQANFAFAMEKVSVLAGSNQFYLASKALNRAARFTNEELTIQEYQEKLGAQQFPPVGSFSAQLSNQLQALRASL
jgi:hypothetical protein